jgi:hypothetical protein
MEGLDRPPGGDDKGGRAGWEASRVIAAQRNAGDKSGIKCGRCGFRWLPLYKRPRICYHRAAPPLSTGRSRESVMAKGQMRSNKEKKKPKADKNLKKGGAAPSPFASGKPAAGQAPNKKS